MAVESDRCTTILGNSSFRMAALNARHTAAALAAGLSRGELTAVLDEGGAVVLNLKDPSPMTCIQCINYTRGC
jgi:hypothetical protein